MNRRGLLVAIAARRSRRRIGGLAQEPIVFGVITPLSPPGETGARPAGQARQRDRRRIPQREGRRARPQGRALDPGQRRQERARRRGLSPAGHQREGGCGVRLHPQRRQHRGQRGRQGDGRSRPWARRPAPATSRPSTTTSRSAPMRSIRRAPPPGSAGPRRTASSACRSSPRPPTTASASSKATEAQNKSMNLGLEIQTIMFDRTTTDLLPQLLQVKAFKPDAIINIGVGQPLDLMITQATTRRPAADSPDGDLLRRAGRPQHWQLHKEQGVGVHFIAFYTHEVEAQRCRRMVRQEVSGEVQRAADLFARSTASPMRWCSRRRSRWRRRPSRRR